MKAMIQKIAQWLVSLTRDPNDGSASSARVAAMLCVLTGCAVALIGVFRHIEQSATVTSLLGGGAANLFARTKSAPKESEG